MEAEAKNNNILADLIKAAGIQEGEGGGDVTINLDEATMAALAVSNQASEQTKGKQLKRIRNKGRRQYGLRS